MHVNFTEVCSSSYGYNIVVAVSAYSCKDEIMENKEKWVGGRMPRSCQGLVTAPGYDQQCFSDVSLLLIYPVFEEL